MVIRSHCNNIKFIHINNNVERCLNSRTWVGRVGINVGRAGKNVGRVGIMGASWLGRAGIYVGRVGINVGRAGWGELAQIWGELIGASWFWGESTGTRLIDANSLQPARPTSYMYQPASHLYQLSPYLYQQVFIFATLNIIYVYECKVNEIQCL